MSGCIHLMIGSLTRVWRGLERGPPFLRSLMCADRKRRGPRDPCNYCVNMLIEICSWSHEKTFHQLNRAGYLRKSVISSNMRALTHQPQHNSRRSAGHRSIGGSISLVRNLSNAAAVACLEWSINFWPKLAINLHALSIPFPEGNTQGLRL